MSPAHCYICNAPITDIDGPVCEQTYLPQSPGCWKLYTEVLEREYNEWGYPDIHRFTVDCYAVQHPTKDVDMKSAKSVITHLIALCLVLENGISLNQVTSYLHKLLANKEATFEWLEPPADLGHITIADVKKAKTLDEHTEIVKEWANIVWQAWSEHHDYIKTITNKLVNQK